MYRRRLKTWTDRPIVLKTSAADMHIWFYALLALVVLYQMWTPFLLAVGFVAVHRGLPGGRSVGC